MSDNSIGRELIKLVQIDQDFCNNTYGVAPCFPATRNYLNFGDLASQINIPDAFFAGDFTINFSMRNINVNSTRRVLGAPRNASYNSLGVDIIASAGFDGFYFRLAIYSGTTTIAVRTSDKTLTTDGLYEIEIERVGNDFFLRVTGSADKSLIGVAITNPKINKISDTIDGFRGYLYDLDLQGVTGGNRFYAIDDNSFTIADSVSAQDGTLLNGNSVWVLAQSQKCFNTYYTCQDKPNYDKGTKTITFKVDQCGEPADDVYTIPSLSGFNVTLPEINFFGRESKNKELGRFGKCSVAFKDIPFSDNHLDPYVDERLYNPLEQGTFWTKFLARNPHYEGWKIRLYDGLVGQLLDDMSVREYELEKISNPDSKGNVTIKATDLMRRLDSKKALYPPASNARLINDVFIGETEITTIGALTDYDTSYGKLTKFLRIGSDIYPISTITDNGNGTFTYTVPILESDFEAGDSIENAARFSDASIYNIILELLDGVYTFFEINPNELKSEISTYLSNYEADIDRTINQPTSVSELLGQIAKETGLCIWYDENLKRLRYKSPRDESAPVIEIDQNNNLIQGTVSSKTNSDDRLTNTYISYNRVIFTGKDAADKSPKYKNILYDIDSNAESEFEYNEKTEYKNNFLWCQTTEQASETSSKLLQMNRDSPREIMFQIDIATNIDIGQVFKLLWRSYTDIYGNIENINWICTGRTREGDRLKITAQEFKFNVPEA